VGTVDTLRFAQIAIYLSKGPAVRRLPRLAAAAAAALLASSLLVTPATAKNDKPNNGASQPERPIQLSLGDSWAAGAVDREEGGYVNRLYDDLREQYNCRVNPRTPAPAKCDKLELRNISRGGATAADLVEAGEQLDQAVALLRDRNGDRRPTNDVEVITLTIGGNDVFGPVVAACAAGVTLQCQQTVAAVFESYQTNLTQILGGLREAAGPDTDIVTTAYDNPLPYCALSALAPVASLVLEGGPGLPAGLNDITRGVAAAYDVDVAETFDLLAPEDWPVNEDGSGDCLHPNGDGHEKVKDAFLDALGL
jgi:lysophospholipase L1-like esterase